MNTTTSHDGTTIAYDRTGEGPPLVLVGGAFSYRSFSPLQKLADLLSDRFTVVNYDRRGRGGSGDTPPYSVEREIEDLGAVIEAVGGSAHVWGVSSGAALALEAAARLDGIESLMLYEAPFIVDDTRPPAAGDISSRTERLLAEDRQADAVRLFMREAVQLPAPLVAVMRLMPMWAKLKELAPTLPYDYALTLPHQRGQALDGKRWSTVTAPTLVVDGSKSPAWMRNATRQLADVLPNAGYTTLEGQNHMIKPRAQAPVLAEFFAREQRTLAVG